MRCCKCRFYEKVNVFGGWCKRYPPNVNKNSTYACPLSGMFPFVAESSWCGEFKGKE